MAHYLRRGNLCICRSFSILLLFSTKQPRLDSLQLEHCVLQTDGGITVPFAVSEANLQAKIHLHDSIKAIQASNYGHNESLRYHLSQRLTSRQPAFVRGQETSPQSMNKY